MCQLKCIALYITTLQSTVCLGCRYLSLCYIVWTFCTNCVHSFQIAHCEVEKNTAFCHREPCIEAFIPRKSKNRCISSLGSDLFITRFDTLALWVKDAKTAGIESCVNTWLTTLDTVNTKLLGDNDSVGPISIWDIKQPLEATRISTVTTLSTSIVRSIVNNVPVKADYSNET